MSKTETGQNFDGIGKSHDLNSQASDERVTSELVARAKQSRVNKSIVAASIVFGLCGGLIGGAFGFTFLMPWYQKNILGEEGFSGSFTQKETRVILDEETAVVKAVEEANPAVVSIVVTKDLPRYEQFTSPFSDFFFQVPSGETENVQIGAGSGFFVDTNGTIVTNRHVVDDPEAGYTVVLLDGTRYSAAVLATDPFNDLAVLKIDGSGFSAVRLGDSDDIKLGQRVIAIGNALGEFQNTVTLGVISGVRRDITASGGIRTETLAEVIQTDAAINFGNSGGPLINLAGEVVGVNTAISSQGQLVGFAIPINQVKKVIDDVERYGKVRRPFIGIRYISVTGSFAEANNLPVDYGAMIVSGERSGEYAVVPGSPADTAGLRELDIILEINGQQITANKQIPYLLRVFSPGDRVVLKISRDQEEIMIQLTLGEVQ